jgi:hypothetical protein
MRVRIRRLRHHGASLSSVPEARPPRQSGSLEVEEHRDLKLARTVLRARLVDEAGIDIVPELLDARLVWAKEGHMRLSGLERIDRAEYAQTWDIEVGAASC